MKQRAAEYLNVEYKYTAASRSEVRVVNTCQIPTGNSLMHGWIDMLGLNEYHYLDLENGDID